MNRISRLLLVSLIAAAAGFLAGCTSADSKDTSIPWSRPASWEGQIPGMGTGH
ncbi:MAG TPA: hypothetical protein VKC60_07175 [Opitutaceae bacterium]|nr:hypothetical protein [Opitutaceae bacterium]